jgi:hypothetical protein
MTPCERLACAIEISRAALQFALAGRAVDVASAFDPAGLGAVLDRASVNYVIVGGLPGAAARRRPSERGHRRRIGVERGAGDSRRRGLFARRPALEA